MGHNRNLADYAHHFDGTHIDLGSGNIETQGVVTFEDVSNVDAVGIVTARAGVKVPDNQKVFLGTGDDLQVYHDGTDTWIDNDEGDLYIRNTGDDIIIRAADDVLIQTQASEGAVIARGDGQVELYHNNSKKLETTTTGATVTGTLVSDSVTSELDLSAISASISDTAVDVFVYDTRKDSDGGAWRKRTQHTSWYNETLNTATRGSRKEFPAVAVIVAETGQVTIYDGDDPDLPMWMVFNGTAGGASHNLLVATGTFCLSALNGTVFMGALAIYVNFISEYSRGHRSTGGASYWNGPYNGNIAERNAGKGSIKLSDQLIRGGSNDVAMTVLPNAPIDSATGLSVPTIAVATDAGISVITDSGSVYDLTTGDVYDDYGKVEFGDNNRLYYTATNTQVLYSRAIPSADQNYTAYNTQNTNRVMFPTMDHGGFTSGHPVRLLGTNGSGNPLLIVKNKASGSNETSYAPSGFGIRPGLTFIDEGETNPTSMVAYTTTSYNTGWMHGDIKGAFLSDTDTTDKTNGQTDPDRSKNNYALSVTGTINKSVVATGADLVAYSGFSGSNYLRHTNTINYGNAATITMGGWSKISGSAVDSTYRYLCSVKSGGEVLGLSIHVDNNSANSGKPYFYDVTNSSLQSDGPRVDDNEWHHILGVLDGTSKKIYIDGELIVSAAVTGINLSSVNITNVGHYVPGNNNTPNYSHGGYLALIKFSASAPSAEQIKKIYNDEKVLFQENAKCTLYGSSDAVTALAYDEDTELLHVGTSSGRSDFQGLRRINNTTTAVTTAISASDELIAEQ